MHVLYLTRSYTPHDHRFLSALAEAGHRVSYLRLEAGKREQESRPLPGGIQALGWDRPRGSMRWWHVPARTRELRLVVARVRPDVVHAGPVQQGGFLAGLADAHPLVTMSWGSDLLRQARIGPGRWVAAHALRRSEVLVCDCQAVRRAAVSLGMPPDRIVVFPWGVDLKHFSPGEDGGLRDRLGWRHAFVLLSTRSWEPIYGIDVLLRAFKKAAITNPELRLLMLGDGSLRDRIRSAVRRAGLEDRIHFGGQVPGSELPAYYRAADVYVSASRSDGSSVSLMEALACGLPALVSDIPGNREWVMPGRNGWLFRDGHAGVLFEGMRSASESRHALPELARGARAVAVERADWRANFQHLLRAYAMAVALHGAPGRRNGHGQP
jgi:glycosyltransferase involved in cell wall biosynthesis